MLIDTHCHLDAAEFDDDRDAVIADARAAGVGAIVVPAVAIDNLDAVRDLAWRHPDVYYAWGIHPMYVDRADEDDLIHLRERLLSVRDDPRLVAIGEIGLDFFVPGLDRERQGRFYIEQLKLARELELPVLLHVRRSQDALLAGLRHVRVSGGIAHAFNGSAQQAQAFLKLGFALGFGGTLSFERSLQIRRHITDLPPGSHVLETDAPDIPPAWLGRGARNSPGQLARIAAEFAGLRGQTVEQALATTADNACRVLPRLARALGIGTASA